MKCNVLDFIPEGEQNAISARELSQLLHCHRRKITLAINHLRCNGEVICSNTHGYYRPACYRMPCVHTDTWRPVKEKSHGRQNLRKHIFVIMAVM